jgi:hypothetical protein
MSSWEARRLALRVELRVGTPQRLFHSLRGRKPSCEPLPGWWVPLLATGRRGGGGGRGATHLPPVVFITRAKRGSVKNILAPLRRTAGPRPGAALMLRHSRPRPEGARRWECCNPSHVPEVAGKLAEWAGVESWGTPRCWARMRSAGQNVERAATATMDGVPFLRWTGSPTPFDGRLRPPENSPSFFRSQLLQTFDAGDGEPASMDPAIS